VKTEDDPLDPHPPMAMTRTLDAIRHLETTVAGASDIIHIDDGANATRLAIEWLRHMVSNAAINSTPSHKFFNRRFSL